MTAIDGDRPSPARSALDLPDLPAEVVLDRQAPGRNADQVDVEPDSELAERRHDRDQVVGLDVLDHDLAAGGRGELDEADLDVVGPDAVLALVELVDALDVQHVRADALDPRSERDEKPAEILDVWGSQAAWPSTVSHRRGLPP